MNVFNGLILVLILYLYPYALGKSDDKDSKKDKNKDKNKDKWIKPRENELQLFKEVFADLKKVIKLDDDYNYLEKKKIKKIAFQLDDKKCIIIYEVKYSQNQIKDKKKYIYPRVLVIETEEKIGDKMPPRLLDVLTTNPF